jgi:hypothetical protein
VGHIVLLGDSIFDNRAYTRGEPDVVSHLQRLLPKPWRATLAAVDGATTHSLPAQLARVGRDVTHAVVAIGGNDALMNRDLLATRVSSTADTLDLFADRVARFEDDYRAALAPVLALHRHTTVCTIYNGNLDAHEASRARVALAMFNDVIVRFGAEHGLGVIELRVICRTPSDYANPIEPSGVGGAKIAQAITHATGAIPQTPVGHLVGR